VSILEKILFCHSEHCIAAPGGDSWYDDDRPNAVIQSEAKDLPFQKAICGLQVGRRLPIQREISSLTLL